MPDQKVTATKAHYAGGGAAIGWAVATILSYAIWGEAAPRPELEMALEVLATAGVAWGVTYLAPANRTR